MVETVIASHFDATRRRGDQLIRVVNPGKRPYRYLVAKNSDNEGFFLVWEGAGKNKEASPRA
jgi:adenine-specific DNA-methyltransferase